MTPDHARMDGKMTKQTEAEKQAVIAKSEREHASLCDEYNAWQDAQGLRLGSADEHWFDEDLSEAQRKWLRDFSDRWEDAALVWGANGARQRRDYR
jgi:hypothetical protein